MFSIFARRHIFSCMCDDELVYSSWLMLHSLVLDSTLFISQLHSLPDKRSHSETDDRVLLLILILILILFPMNSKCALYWLIGLELRVWCSCAAVKHKHNLLTWNCSSRAVIFLLMCYITLMFTCVFSQVRLMGISQAKLLAVVACLHVDNRYLLCTVRFLYRSRSSVVVPAH